MARARLLKPDFFEDEKLAELPFTARILFQSLWCQADREGRLEDRPARLAAFAFPYDNAIQVEARRDAPCLLDQLIESGIVRRYEVDGQLLLLIPRFKDHQKIHINEPQSVLPPPMVPNGSQSIPIVANVAGSGSRKEAEAVTEAEAKAEDARAPEIEKRVIEFKPQSEPFFPDDEGFVGEFVKHWSKVHGKHPGSGAVADAADIERTFGFDACMTVFRDTGWEKPPNWIRPKLEERARRAIEPVANAPSRPKSLRYQEA